MAKTHEAGIPAGMGDKPGLRSFDRVPASWGPRISTGLADLAAIRPGPDDADAEADAHFLLVFQSPQRRRELRLDAARSTIFDAPAGSLEIVPAGASYFSRWQHPMECLLLSLEPARLQQFAQREFGVGRVELRALKPGTVDRTANGIAGLLRDEMRRADHSPARLYIESLTTALMVHIVRSHSSLAEQPEAQPLRGGLSPRVWRDMEDFIRENLAADIALASLASRAGLSYSHFLRAFRQTTGVSPHRYIMQLRAYQARHQAATSRIPLKQIAAQCGFASQSHMTTVLKALLNETPGEVRRQSGAAAIQDQVENPWT